MNAPLALVSALAALAALAITASFPAWAQQQSPQPNPTKITPPIKSSPSVTLPGNPQTPVSADCTTFGLNGILGQAGVLKTNADGGYDLVNTSSGKSSGGNSFMFEFPDPKKPDHKLYAALSFTRADHKQIMSIMIQDPSQQYCHVEQCDSLPEGKRAINDSDAMCNPGTGKVARLPSGARVPSVVAAGAEGPPGAPMSAPAEACAIGSCSAGPY